MSDLRLNGAPSVSPELVPNATKMPGKPGSKTPLPKAPTPADDLTLTGVNAAPSDLGLDAGAKKQLTALAALAEKRSKGRAEDGQCLGHVYGFMEEAGFGKTRGAYLPEEASRTALGFGRWLAAPANADALGLRKLDLVDPAKAPRGAVVIYAPSEGVGRHGNIGVVLDQGRMADGALVPLPRHGEVMGIYVPANQTK